MRKIREPDFKIKDIFTKHIDHFKKNINNEKDNNNDIYIESAMNYFCKKEQEYKDLALRKSLTSIEVNKYNTYCKMKNSYEYIYSKKFKYRKKIVELANGRCPICDSEFGYGTVELDHVLPKSKFDDYAITPINLIPICRSCNKAKSNKFGNSQEGILTPYYDSYPLNKILKMKILIDNNDIKTVFSIIDENEFKKIHGTVSSDNCIDNDEVNIIYNKIKHHFFLHKIDKTLSMKSQILLNSIITSLAYMKIDNIENRNIEEYLLEFTDKMYKNYVDDRYIKKILVDTIMNHEKKEDIYTFLTKRIENEIKSINYLDNEFNV
jgi:possible EA31 gene protein, phage lambda|nr:HNH endonuclease signature motif containing protein [uncultured Peptostreptococcus sp.]